MSGFSDKTFRFVFIMKSIEIVKGDLTTLAVDAIVNAANSSLLGGGGVDGAIHRAAGPELLAACRLLGGCAVGQSKMTDAFRLPCRKVIHTVGPVWNGGGRNEAGLLASCYKTALDLAEENDISSIAFPCISTGAYRFPRPFAAEIAVKAVRGHAYGGKVVFCCFLDEDYGCYRVLCGQD